MNKNILVITGSPRKGGNSDLMADAFIRGANRAGNKVTKLDAAALKINPCRACDGCYKNGIPCCFGDDFNKVAPLIEKAEIIVFATPLYWYTFPTQIKLVIDKFYSFFGGQRDVWNKKSILMACGGEAEDRAYEGLLTSYDRITELLKWTVIDKFIVKAVEAKGAIKETDALKKAEALGESIL